VVATANNIDCIPPEILRKGRFDEMFFLNLPTREEREAIFEVHLKKYRPNEINNFQLSLLGQLSKDFSGAEIEAVAATAGTGTSSATGTAACATAVAANKNEFIGNKVDIQFKEGLLKIEIDAEDNIFMTGPVSEIKNLKLEI